MCLCFSRTPDVGASHYERSALVGMPAALVHVLTAGWARALVWERGCLTHPGNGQDGCVPRAGTSSLGKIH
jgi:hypothetical protein